MKLFLDQMGRCWIRICLRIRTLYRLLGLRILLHHSYICSFVQCKGCDRLRLNAEAGWTLFEVVRASQQCRIYSKC